MNTTSTQQEILIMINTRFSAREWAKTNGTERDSKLSGKEQLIEACWNGLAPEMLPEFFEKNDDKLMTLWEINDADSFISLEFGDFMQKKANEYSVNPYFFMQVQQYN